MDPNGQITEDDKITISRDSLFALLSRHRDNPNIYGPAKHFVGIFQRLANRYREKPETLPNEMSFTYPAANSCTFYGEVNGARVERDIARSNDLRDLSCPSIKQHLATIVADHLKTCNSQYVTSWGTPFKSDEVSQLLWAMGSPVSTDDEVQQVRKQILYERSNVWVNFGDQSAVQQKFLELMGDVGVTSPKFEDIDYQVIGWSTDANGVPKVLINEDEPRLFEGDEVKRRSYEILARGYATTVLYDPQKGVPIGGISAIAAPNIKGSFPVINADAITNGLAPEFKSKSATATHIAYWNPKLVDAAGFYDSLFNGKRSARFLHGNFEPHELSPELDGIVWFDSRFDPLDFFLARHRLTVDKLDPSVVKMLGLSD